MELLDSDIHFPKYDIRVPNLQAITTPIQKLAIYHRLQGLRPSGWGGDKYFQAEACRRAKGN
jgi:hypothetical protein